MAALAAVVASERGARMTIQTESYVHAEFTTRIFRFVDDVEFLWNADLQVAHFRSASRVGTWDLGTNRRRIERIRARVERLQRSD